MKGLTELVVHSEGYAVPTIFEIVIKKTFEKDIRISACHLEQQLNLKH
jgi:hypothetical protein